MLNTNLMPFANTRYLPLSGVTIIGLIASLLLSGCFMGAGTHGAIKSYSYACSKNNLQQAIMKVIKNNPNIYRDTSLDYLGSSPLLDSADCINCSAGQNYYNDIKHYVTIKITSGQEVNDYTFRYYGADESWATATASKMFICYANDKAGHGGSEGNGGIIRRTKALTKRLTNVFEAELIAQVDKELGMGHTEE